MDRSAAVHGVAKSQTQLSDFTFTFHFHALEKEMATHSSVLAWRIPGTVEPGGLPSMGSHRVGHDWSDLAAAAAPGDPCSRWSQETQAWRKLLAHVATGHHSRVKLVGLYFTLTGNFMQESETPYFQHFIDQSTSLTLLGVRLVQGSVILFDFLITSFIFILPTFLIYFSFSVTKLILNNIS